MARVLIIGCGCRGRAFAAELLDLGHPVRGTTRDPAVAAQIEASGAEAYVGDPNRVGTLVAALDGVAVLCLLLASARGPSDALADLHGRRLAMLLARMIDTTVRGVLYETGGSVEPGVLCGGAEIVRSQCAGSRIPCALLAADPVAHEGWLAAAVEAVAGLLEVIG